MSMKHCGVYHKSADKKRRLNRSAKKDAMRERRALLDQKREAELKGTSK